MPLRFHNALTGRLEDFSPAAPPLISFLWRRDDKKRSSGKESRRAEIFVSVLLDALVYLGYGVDQAAADAGVPVELYCGSARPPQGSQVWLKPGPADVPRGASWSEPEFRYLCLRTHYRRAPDFSASFVSEVLGEFAFLRDSANRLEASHAGSASNPKGLSGYRKRFRDACANDLDFPEALNCLQDALRPGALSPGSQLQAWREFSAVLGI